MEGEGDARLERKRSARTPIPHERGARPLGGGKKTAAGVGLRWAATERLTIDQRGLRSTRETIGTQGNGLLTAMLNFRISPATGHWFISGDPGFGNQSE